MRSAITTGASPTRNPFSTAEIMASARGNPARNGAQKIPSAPAGGAKPACHIQHAHAAQKADEPAEQPDARNLIFHALLITFFYKTFHFSVRILP